MSSVDVNEHHTMTGGVGSYLYMAPEVVRYEDYNEKARIMKSRPTYSLMAS